MTIEKRIEEIKILLVDVKKRIAANIELAEMNKNF